MKKRAFKNLLLKKNTISNLDINLTKGGVEATDPNDILHNTKLPGVCTCYNTCHLYTTPEGTCGIVQILTINC